MSGNPDEIAAAGWLVSVKPIVQGSDTVHFAAGFKTASEAEAAMKASPQGRDSHVIALRPLNVIEMMHLRLKPGEIRRHD